MHLLCPLADAKIIGQAYQEVSVEVSLSAFCLSPWKFHLVINLVTTDTAKCDRVPHLLNRQQNQNRLYFCNTGSLCSP